MLTKRMLGSCLLFTAIAIGAWAPGAQAVTLLSDDFNDNSIDGSKWTVVTTNIPQNPKSAIEQNQQMELQGRAHLNTVQQFDPLAQSGQGIRITGQWTFVSNDDFMQIITRSDGAPNPGNCCGETTNGLEFFVQMPGSGGDQMTIRSRNGATATVTGLNNNGALGAVAGETYDFEIRDTGTNLYFTMSQVGGSKQRTVTATSTSNLATDLVSIHNRESGRRSNLDDIVIDTPSFLGPGSVQFPILLSDNFDNNALDASKWKVVTAGVPAGANVQEINSRITLTGRGHLVTQQEFDPNDHGIRIQGRWTFGSDDFMQVLTRTDGTPGGAFGETLNGIEFFAFDGNDTMQISQRVAGGNTVLTSTGISIAPGEVFEFLITDDGFNLFFELTQVGGDGTTASLSTVSGQGFASNFVAFHNRESGRVAQLDDVVISQLDAIPEPTTAALGLLGLAMLAQRRRRPC